MGLKVNRRTQYLVFWREAYGAMPIIVKTFFALFSTKKSLQLQELTEFFREILSFSLLRPRSSGQTPQRNILCPHVIHIMSH
jgi:hypothetical protein